MKYIGELFAKVAGKYLPVTMSAADVDKVIEQRDEALAVLEIYANMGGPGNRASAAIDKIKASS